MDIAKADSVDPPERAQAFFWETLIEAEFGLSSSAPELPPSRWSRTDFRVVARARALLAAIQCEACT